MKLSENHFQILDTLDSQEITTQRQLAACTGISLGQINYVLKRLLEKGLVKIGNFRGNPRKIGYVYLLTPKGIETKSKLAAKFVMARLKEYNAIREKLTERLTAIENKGHVRAIFVGPEIIKEFVDSIIKETGLDLVLVGHCTDWQEIKNHDPESFDIIVAFNGNQDIETGKPLGIPADSVVPLW